MSANNTQAGGGDFDARSLLHQLCSGELVDAASIMMTVARIKNMRSRTELMSAARESAPQLNLSKPSFLTLVDLLRVCLREANNAGDFKCVRNVFNLAYQYSMTPSGGRFYVGRLLQSHEAWKNINFWLYCAEELIRYDIMRFSYWMQRTTSSPVLPIEEPIFIATIVIIRLQAIIFNSMQVMRVPADVVLGFINTAADVYGLSGSERGAGADILRRPVSDFIAWLQDTIIFEMRSDLTPFIEGGKLPKSSSNGSFQRLPSTSDASLGGAGSATKINNATSVLSFDMGFCPLLELLHRLVVKRANASSAVGAEGGSLTLSSSGYLGGNGSQATGPINSCVCGQPTGQWKVLGTFSTDRKASSLLNRRMIRHVLCETCYRRITQTDCAPAPPQTVVAMGSCAVSTNWPGNLPNNFLAIFYGSGLNDYREGVAANISEDNLRATYTLRIRDTLLDRSESGPPRMMSSSAVVKLLAIEGKELTSIGIGGTGVPRTSSLSSDGVLGRTNSMSSRQSSVAISADRTSSGSSRLPTDQRKRGKVYQAKDSIHIQRERQLKDSQIQGFISAMQSGVDVLKFGHNPIHPLQTRTFFIDKEVSRLCWLPPGREDLIPTAKSSVPLREIKRIQKGSGKYELCLNLICTQREITLQIEDDELRKLIINGLIGLVDKLKRTDVETGGKSQAEGASSTTSLKKK